MTTAAAKIVKAHELCVEMSNLESSLALAEDRSSKTKLKVAIGKLRKQIVELDVLDAACEEEPSLEVILSKGCRLQVRFTELQSKIEALLDKVANDGDEEAADKLQVTLEKMEATVKSLTDIVEEAKVLRLPLNLS